MLVILVLLVIHSAVSSMISFGILDIIIYLLDIVKLVLNIVIPYIYIN